jgi:hypothetical protein
MFSTDLIVSTEEPVDFSVGALPPGSTKQWGLEISEDITRGVELDIWEIIFRQKIASREELIRLFCHILVERIPRHGIPELFETLMDIYEFYSTQIEQERALLPQPQQVRARRGTTAVRPEFPVIYDEE